MMPLIPLTGIPAATVIPAVASLPFFLAVAGGVVVGGLVWVIFRAAAEARQAGEVAAELADRVAAPVLSKAA